MITPLLFVKILRTTRRNGGFSTRDTITHRVSVCRGDAEFIPVPAPGMRVGNPLNAEGQVDSLAVAKTTALSIAKMLGITSVQLFKEERGDSGNTFHNFEEEVIEE